MGLGRAVHHLGNEMRGDEQHSSARAEYDVARQNDSISEPGRGVEAGHEKIAYRSGIDAAVVDLYALHLLHLLNVADAAPDDRSAGLCLGRDGGGEVSAEEGSLVDLIIHINDQHVALDQRIDHPLIIIALAVLLHTDAEHHLMQIGAGRREGGGYGASDELASVVVKGVQPSLELGFIALNEDGLPDLLEGHALEGFEVAVGHARTSVLEAFALPLGGQRDDFFFYIEMHICISLVILCSSFAEIIGRVRQP